MLGQKMCRHFKALCENHTTQLLIFLKLKPIVKKLNLVVEIGFKTVCAAVLWLKISYFF